MKRHYLKTINPYFTDILNDLKTFEVRKNDRDFKVGDVLHLQEFVPPSTYTGREIRANIIYMLNDAQYCKEGYVVLGIDIYGIHDKEKINV